jgi:hypothetical protein
MGTRKTEEGRIHPDRDAQFRHISRRVAFHLSESQPVISVESRKKESGADEEALIQHSSLASLPSSLGSSSSSSSQGFSQGALDALSGGAHPRGIYDPKLARLSACIRSAYDSASFTCDSIYGWWMVEGKELFPKASSLLITADNVGGMRRHALWKTELQKLSSAIGLPVEFCRYPPGTSKWNGNAQRLFSFISAGYLGEPSRDFEITVKLISREVTVRTMALGLKLDHSSFPAPSAPQEDDMKALVIYPAEFHGDWNYSIAPDIGPLMIDPVFRNMVREARDQ